MTVPNHPLLLTAAIDTGGVPFVAVRNRRERAIHYYCALVCWIRDSGVRRLVLCENTGTDICFDSLQAFANAHGKQLEVLTFTGNREAARFGKGYGEGLIIAHALKHSRFLAQATAFYKTTGRLFLRNFDVIAARRAAWPSLFIEDYHRSSQRKVRWAARGVRFIGARVRSSEGLGRALAPVKHSLDAALSLPVWVNTRFFKAEIGFYREYLGSAYRKVDDLGGYYLEHAYADALASRPDVRAWNEWLQWVGVSGTMGKVVDGDSDYSAEVRAEAEVLFSASNGQWPQCGPGAAPAPALLAAP